MRKKRLLVAAIMSFSVAAAISGQMLAEAAEVTGDKEAAKILAQTYPKFQAQEVNPTQVPGMFEVVNATNTIYFFPATGHLIFGEVWSKEGKNITVERRQEKMVSTLPLGKALKIGSGKNVIIEITDPDCPYCRKGSQFLDEQKDVTRYIFFLPLPMHPHAANKVKYILDAKNKETTYRDVMAGKHDAVAPIPAVNAETEAMLNEHKKVAELLQVTATPKYFVNGTVVSGADLKRIESLLKK